MTIETDLLQEIRDFVRKTGMAETTFGRLAANDGKLVARLNAGSGVTTRTVEKIRAYLRANGTPAKVRPDPAADAGVLHRIADALDLAHIFRLLEQPVRLAVLHDAVRIRQTAVADARVSRVEFHDVDAGDQGVEDVFAACHHVERGLDTRLRAAVLVRVPIRGRDDDRAAAALGRLRPDEGQDHRGGRVRPALRDAEPAGRTPVS